MWAARDSLDEPLLVHRGRTWLSTAHVNSVSNVQLTIIPQTMSTPFATSDYDAISALEWGVKVSVDDEHDKLRQRPTRTDAV